MNSSPNCWSSDTKCTVLKGATANSVFTLESRITVTVQDIEICFVPRDKVTFLLSGDEIYNTESRACGRNDCVKPRYPLATAKIGPIIHHISETCKTGRKLLLFTHRKSHMCFPLVPKLVTLNDLERRNGRYFALFRGIRPPPRTYHRKILATPTPSRYHRHIRNAYNRLPDMLFV